MKLYFRICEKESTISYVQRYKEYSKKTILRYSWASLVDQLTEEDHVIVIHDEVSQETLKWMESRHKNGLISFVEVPKHDWDYHQHTVTLFEFLEQHLSNKGFHFLIEDDYLFAPDALEAIRSLESFYGAFFVPYDYPDRYREPSLCQVVLSPYCHWRTINSCTMTIGAKADTWKHFLPMLKEAASTSNDKVFEEIFKQMACISPLPGLATHLTATHHTPFFKIEERLQELDIV